MRFSTSCQFSFALTVLHFVYKARNADGAAISPSLHHPDEGPISLRGTRPRLVPLSFGRGEDIVTGLDSNTGKEVVMKSPKAAFFALAVAGAAVLAVGQPSSSPVTAIKAGRLIDPETGTAAARQVILVQGEKITAVGPNPAIPAGARVLDLSGLTVLPGLVDAHTHMALTYKEQPENYYYYLTYVMESTPLRAIQAASNGIQLLNSGFTVVRDVGNNALYADAALRQAIEQGWLPGPTVIPSGPMIGSTGGQYWPTPEM
ncbi:MAG: amidohydrolase family protein, partial [Candidatus Aminicenantes bacterium]|nr:amidohydrolase family protein [Candidatus Aminicenantes bacterium]